MEIIKNKLIMLKEQSFEYNQQIFSSTTAADFIRKVTKLQEEPEEVLILIALSSKNEVVGFCEVARGTINYSLFSGREIFKRALLMNCSKIILAHNHPSGDPTPSQQDIKATEAIKKLAEMLDIQLIDHIIIGFSEDYTIIGKQKIYI